MKSTGETSLDSSKRVATPRAGKIARRMAHESGTGTEQLRSTKVADKSVSQGYEKERKRAEIYAINAVLR